MKSTDTIKAKLTPREAILNRNAAELLGRHNIARLNAHGNMLAKRGVDLASLPSDPTPGPSTENMLGYAMGTYDVGDDRGDLMRDVDTTFYGGGQVPAPTPTPTPIGRGYQYGTDDVRRRRMNGASRIQGITFSRDALRGIPSRSGRNISANFPQGQVIQSTSPSGGGGYGYGGGTLPPDQNPAYQNALRNNPTPASRYASNGTQSPASFVGKYRSDYGPRAVVSTGTDTFRTYNPEGGYIARTGNAANFLNKQFNADTSGAAPQPVAPIQPSVATTPTSLTVNSTGFQPQGLEANPFTEPIKLELQPRRYSDYY